MRLPNERRAEIKEPFMTLQEIADTMGISREMVRQIERTALNKMRKRLIALGIEPEHFISTLKYNRPIKPSEATDGVEFELMYDKENEDD